MKDTIIWTICLLLLVALSCLAGCNGEEEKNPSAGLSGPGVANKELDALELEDIVYELGALKVDDTCKMRVRFEEKSVATGEEVTARVAYPASAEKTGLVYYIVDWGDGTRSHNGPYSAGVSGVLRHVYRKAGQYRAHGYCVNLESSKTLGWTPESIITVTGEDQAAAYLTKIQAISSSQEGMTLIHDNSTDTVWRSPAGQEQAWIGYEFDGYYSLHTLEVKVSSSTDLFPSDFSIEFTTDRGENWYRLSRYYYVTTQQNGWYGNFSARMSYPNPAGATILYDLHGISANGIRIVAQSYAPDVEQKGYLEVAEMRVTGTSDLFFYTSQGGVFDADLNNMWLVYGTAETEPALDGRETHKVNPEPFRSGAASMLGSHEWLEWDSLQIAWQTDETMRNLLRKTIAAAKLGPDGWSNSDDMVWGTDGARYHINDETYGNHYSTNSAFILGVKNTLAARNDIEGFLDKRNSDKRLLSERLDSAMQYMLEELDGDTGLLTIHDPRKTGDFNGASSNYWDGVRVFGYQSAYENVLFYKAVLAMAEVKYMQGDLQAGAEYMALAKKTKDMFNQTFWDEGKGRYISSVDIHGTRHDYGITYVNFMACEAGLASLEQAQQIYDWVDGKRIIPGETSTGSDIYDEFKYAARSNTVNMDTDFYMGHFEYSSQNGGTIFYISHHDLMGRIRYLGADNALARLQVILQEFHTLDLLRFGMAGVGGQPQNPTYFYTTSIIGEFPESGLVPLTFVTGFLGLEARNDGLHLSPAIPSSMEYAGIREYLYNDKVYSIRIDRDVTEPKLTQEGKIWHLTVPAEGSWIVTPDNQVKAIP